MENEADFFINLLNLSVSDDRDGSSWKMFLDSSAAMKGRISEPSSVNWMKSGMVWRGEFLTQSASEHPNGAVAYSLSQVISQDSPVQFFLTTPELQSLLTRAEAREKPLTEDLATAINLQISTLSKMPQLEECILLARKEKDIDLTEKLGLLIQGGEVTLYVRHMSPLEYEILQGFPEGWTQVDTKALETPST